MSDLGDNLASEMSNYGILIEAGAIDLVGFNDPSDYWWVPEQVQGTDGTLE